MDEHQLATLLRQASDEAASGAFDARDDLRRGQIARRRGRHVRTAAVVLGAAAVVGGGVAMWHALPTTPLPSTAPAGGGSTPTTVATSPATVLAGGAASGTTASSPLTVAPSSPVTPPESFPFTVPQPAFLHVLFEVAQEHLDPAGTRLRWSEGFTGSPGPGRMELGRKFSWKADGEPGEAMVYVGVGDLAEPDRLGCGQYDYNGSAKCVTGSLPNGQQAEIMSAPSGRQEVHWSRPDGSYVFVIVDPVFRNNSTVASSSPLPTLDQLKEFVLDPRLVLPAT